MPLLKYGLICTVWIVLVVFLQLIVLEIVEPRRVRIEESWVERIRNTKVCNEIDGGINEALNRGFSNLIVNYIGNAGLIEGAYIGLLFQSKFFEGRSKL